MTLPLHSHVPVSDRSGETSWGLRVRVRVGVGESESDEGESGSDESEDEREIESEVTWGISVSEYKLEG